MLDDTPAPSRRSRRRDSSHQPDPLGQVVTGGTWTRFATRIGCATLVAMATMAAVAITALVLTALAVTSYVEKHPPPTVTVVPSNLAPPIPPTTAAG